MAGLVPAIPIPVPPRCPGDRDARHKAGHDVDREERYMKRISFALLSIAVLVGVSPTHAQDKYPSKPIKVEVPFGAGSATDIVIRIVGDQLRHELGQQIVVENKPGAFGILAIEEMVKARPDGYTLQVGNPGTNVLT